MDNVKELLAIYPTWVHHCKWRFANLPLSSREQINAIVEDKCERAIKDIEVLKHDIKECQRQIYLTRGTI